MKRAGLFIAIVVVVMCAGGWASGEVSAPPKQAQAVATPAAQPVSISADDLKTLNDKIDTLNQSNVSNLISFTDYFLGGVIGVFAILSGFLLFRAHQVNKDAEAVLRQVEEQSKEAHKELEEIYKVKESIYEQKEKTREYLERARESMDRFVRESQLSINALLGELKAESDKRIQSLDFKINEAMTKIDKLSEAAQIAAKGAKESEENTEKIRKALDYFEEGNKLWWEGRYEEAAESCNKAIMLDPGNLNAHLGKGICLDELGRREEAIAAYDKAIELDPKYAKAYNNKGYSLIWLKEYDNAIETIDKVLSIDEKYRAARINKALALQKRGAKGDVQEAGEILEGLLKEDNRDADAARAYALFSRSDEMLSLARELVAKDTTLKRTFKRELEFEAYWNDPDFIAIVGE
ncbi:MAG: tetratricopeptide repeat protein [Nitrospirae bacterium]|nr:tetratricopeptide repeat protein [Nitrospirota bacterium]